ncbi:MAG TPA: glycosyltransferase family 39 protein [Candidatus Polarisedimenticolia bacterium]|nr:glycosyltransferase family 39 protein [Candidatus Polarisedimenticolia bacterium]
MPLHRTPEIAAPAPPAPKQAQPAALGVLAGLAAAKLLAHLPAINQYGYFRDELYYLASTRHLALGYVDHPPLSIAVLAGVRALAGDSLPALRLTPLLCGLAVVVLTALLARELGGGRLAQGAAGLAVLSAPVYLAIHHYYSMNALDHVAWASAALLLAKALRTGRASTWMLLGLVLGLGLLNKLSVLWLGAGIGAGLLLTPCRRFLLSRGPWLAAAIAAALFAPHVAWQAAHGWPTLEFMSNATRHKMVQTGLAEFLSGQVLTMNPATLLIWLPGLLSGLRPGAEPRARLFSIAWLGVFALLASGGPSRSSYLAPAYPMLFASGGVSLERLREAAARARAGSFARRLRAAAAPAALSAMILIGAPLVPYALPVLPPDAFLAYMKAIGIAPRGEERSARAELPQQYADMFGWEEMAEQAARAYALLTPQERARAAVFGQNYGEAGAIDVLGKRLGLPPAISGHNSYWMWGPPPGSIDVVIILGGDHEGNAAFFEEVTVVGRVECRRCMPYERDLAVSIGRRPRLPLEEAWPRLKRFM